MNEEEMERITVDATGATHALLLAYLKYCSGNNQKIQMAAFEHEEKGCFIAERAEEK